MTRKTAEMMIISQMRGSVIEKNCRQAGRRRYRRLVKLPVDASMAAR